MVKTCLSRLCFKTLFLCELNAHNLYLNWRDTIWTVGNVVLATSTLMYSRCIVSAHIVLIETVNYTQNVENGTDVTIVCNMGVTLPAWTGPPDSMAYTMYNYTSFNPAIGTDKMNRLSWAANNRDLILYPITMDDAGTYQCQSNFQTWVINLTVRGMFRVCGV